MTQIHPHVQHHLSAIEHLDKAALHHRKAAKHKLSNPHHSAHHAQIALAHTLFAVECANDAAKSEALEYEKDAD
jgi:hypothetical protein